MLSLLTDCFDNVCELSFEQDLESKDAVLFLRNSFGSICGFSSLVSFNHVHRGTDYRVVFSGDTVITPKYWGSLELPIVWGSHLLDCYEKDPLTPLLWFLISKGIRTFKFLPVFFQNYYPNPQEETKPEIQSLINSLGKARFGERYNKEAGVITAVPNSYYLRPELARRQVSSKKRPYIDHFYDHNPEYYRGTELLCLTEFSPQNLQPFIYRQILNRRAKGDLGKNAA
jgi:hypothetical protein